MGLFGSKQKTYVGTTVVRVIEDDALPNSPKTAAIKAILQNEEIAGNILSELTGCIGNKAERMYEYAKDNYPPGLPKKQYHSRNQGIKEVEAVLSNLEGTPVLVEYSMVGPVNFLHLGWMEIVSQMQYNPSTNSVWGGNTHFLEDMYPVLPSNQFGLYDDSCLEMWGISPKAGYTPFRVISSGLDRVVRQTPAMQRDGISKEFIRVTVVSSIKEAVSDMGIDKPKYETYEYELPDLDEEANYFHVKYVVNGITKYWIYQKGLGTYPSLDLMYEDGEGKGDYYPWLYMRFEKKSLNEDTSSDLFKSSKRMSKYLNIDYSSMVDKINENPDIDDVEQAILMFAIPANTQNQLEMDYLFRFFNDMYLSVGGNLKPDILSTTRPSTMMRLGVPALTTTVIQDKKFKMSLSTGGISKQRYTGQLGEVGYCESGRGTESYELDALDSDGYPIKVSKTTDYHYYRKQISDWMYDEIRILDLKMKFFVYGNHVTTGDDELDILMIPMDREIMKDYSLPDKEELFSRGLHFIFNSRVTVKVKWYQTGVFQAVLSIVAVVITVFTYGATWQAMGAALAAGGAVAVAALKLIFIGVLKAIVYGVAFKLFVQAVGGEFALLVAVIAAAYGFYEGVVKGFAQNTWATTMLETASGITSAISSTYKDAMEELAEEFDVFRETSKSMYEELDKVSKELLSNNPIISPWVVFGEQPDAYFNRTVHSGNIGVQSINAVASYVDYSLRLPTINETLI